MAERKIEVTISRIPDCILDELEKHIAQLHDEFDLDPDQMHTLQALIVGYGAAWDAIENMSTEHRAPSTEHRAPSTEHRAPNEY